MSYNTFARMAHDGDLQQRMIASAAQEGVEEPQSWVLSNIWQLVTTGTLSTDYQYAIDVHRVDRPGYYEDIVNDGAILSVIQARIAALAEPPA